VTPVRGIQRVSVDDLAPNNPAGLALARILRLALPDEERCQRVLRSALLSAKRAELPTDGDELLRLVRAHLAPQLSGDVAPNLVFAMLDDLKAEIEQQRAVKDPSSSSRLRAATRFPPPASPRSEDEAPAEATPFPKLRESVSKLRRATAVGALRVPVHADVAPVPTGPASLVLVEPDRMMRAALARSLVGAQFDVSVLESTSQMLPWLASHREPVIAILDVVEEGVEHALPTLLAAHAGLSVIAWTEASPVVAEAILATAGLRRFRVVSKTAAAGEVVTAVRSLSGGAAS
jgi:hypothetical protein